MATRDVVLQNLAVQGTKITARPPYTIDGGGGAVGAAVQVFPFVKPNWTNLGAAEVTASGSSVAIHADFTGCTDVMIVGMAFMGVTGNGSCALARITDIVNWTTWDRLGTAGLDLAATTPQSTGWDPIGAVDVDGPGIYTLVGYGGDGSNDISADLTVYVR